MRDRQALTVGTHVGRAQSDPSGKFSAASLVLSGFQMVALAQRGAQPSVNQSARQLTPEEAWSLSASGRKLSSEEAESLENRLSSDAWDLAGRFTLIGYYSSKHDESFRAKRRDRTDGRLD